MWWRSQCVLWDVTNFLWLFVATLSLGVLLLNMKRPCQGSDRESPAFHREGLCSVADQSL